MDTLGFEPRAFRMRNGCDTTTPCARLLSMPANPHGVENKCGSGVGVISADVWNGREMGHIGEWPCAMELPPFTKYVHKAFMRQVFRGWGLLLAQL